MLPVSLGRRGGVAFCCVSADGFGTEFDMVFYLSVLSVAQKPCGHCVSFLQCNTVTGSGCAGLVPAQCTTLQNSNFAASSWW